MPVVANCFKCGVSVNEPCFHVRRDFGRPEFDPWCNDCAASLMPEPIMDASEYRRLLLGKS